MSLVAKSVYYFGLYLFVLGIVLTVAPNMLLSTFRFPETQEVWIRVLGVVVFALSLYYVIMARSGSKVFFTLTVYARSLVMLFFLVFFFLNWAPAQLLLFGFVDLAGALWTFWALRNSPQSN